MSRITKWKLEKTKVKVVFRLQFHATHVPQPGWDKLFISFIPADIGKPTAKTAKANVRNGICKWSDPIYETTKLLQDARTKVYDEKLYKFVVSMGSTRSSLLGEAIINLAEYADASKPSSVALSLNGCDFGTVLHVTVQLLTSKTGFREFEQQRELRERGYQMNKGHSTHEGLLNLRENTATPANDQIDKVNARVRFKPESSELRSLGEVGELNEDYDLSVAIDGSSNTSESLNTDKNDISSTHEIDSIKSTVSGDIGGYSLGQSNQSEKEDQTNNRLLRQGSSDWIHGWSSDYSVDHDLASAYEENNKLRRSLEAAESSILELKLEVSSVQSLANELGVETQRLAEQLTEEISSTEQLAKEISILKSECSNVKDDFELLRHAKESHHYNGTGTGMSSLGVSKNSIPLPLDVQVSVAMRNRDLPDSPVDTKNYVVHDFYKRWMQDLVLLEHKVREIRSHTSLGYHDRDRGQLHSDLEILESVLQNLKQNTPRLTSLLHMEGTNYKEAPATDVQIPEYCYRNEGIEWQSVGHPCSENTSPGLSSHHWLSRGIHPIEDNIDAAFEMKGKLHELSHELKESITERESLTKKMNQMERYYETLIQELEESQRQTLSELQKLQKEHTTCLDTILAFQEQIAKMHQDMNEQFLQFSEDRRGLDSHNKELERRATISETALKRVHLNYSITVDKLQKDLELLSMQVLSMFETNENLARQTFAEVSQLYFEEYLREHPEEASTCMPKDGLKSSVRQGQCKPAFQGFLPEVIPSKRIEQDPFPLFSGVHMEINNKSLSVTQKLDEFPESFRILKSKLGSQESDIVGTLQCHKTISEEKNQLTKDDINSEEMKKSLRLHEQLCQEAETELSEMYAFIVHMDVFSKVLQEKLYDLNDGARHMKQELGDVAQQLEHSTQSNEILMLQLHTALDEVRILRQNDAKYVSQCNDLMSTNYMLEGKLQEFLNENHLLSEKVMESERLITDYETKYESCTAEKKVLENLLKNESLEKSSLQREIQTTIEEIKALKMAFDKQSLEKDTLQKSSTLIQSKLMDLYCNMISYSEQINGPYSGIPLQKDLDDKDCTAIILSIEELQQEAQVKFSLVNDERERLMIESKNYECMFMSCTAEKVKLEDSLKQKKLENIGLQNKISSLTEDIKALEVEFSKQVSIKDDLQRTFAHLQDKLGELCSSIVSCIEQVNQPSPLMSLQKELENKNLWL
ncbi:hypothetical protein QJS10_CPB18g01270 [Acorus calamus]|uniref:C2 NT-type domain-containing protein n=1 Tax=Acorus calamus TaxID=4465 RepID=A0AAV9CLI7_ACOCL|nr:hypothetical protein QJS10_CPB18g01270 [Acorus calamus]